MMMIHVQQYRQLLHGDAGGDRSVLLRDILRRGAVQGRRSGFRAAQRLVSAQRLEHDGLRGRRDWVRDEERFYFPLKKTASKTI